MKTKTILLVTLAFICLSQMNAQVGIGTTTPNASSILDVDATDKGFLPPRMTTTERNAINGGAPAEGLVIYNTISKCLETWDGASWISLCSGAQTTVPNPCDPTSPTAIVDVVHPLTGDTWMDRNLGASRVAQSSDDFLAYGNLYQWGRGSDGHQCMNWTSGTAGTLANTTSSTLSTVPSPGPNFITVPTNANSGANWYTGTSPAPDDLWLDDGNKGPFDPCPEGYRVPTFAEWRDEVSAWDGDTSNGYQGGISGNGVTDGMDPNATPLKFPAPGYLQNNGALLNPSTVASYWTGRALTFDRARSIRLSTAGAGAENDPRANGQSVRCIKD
jgi:uncharacterized protein (TIGR02145 family)